MSLPDLERKHIPEFHDFEQAWQDPYNHCTTKKNHPHFISNKVIISTTTSWLAHLLYIFVHQSINTTGSVVRWTVGRIPNVHSIWYRRVVPNGEDVNILDRNVQFLCNEWPQHVVVALSICGRVRTYLWALNKFLCCHTCIRYNTLTCF